MIISFSRQANLELAHCFIVLIRLQLLTNANFLVAMLHSIKTFAASLIIVVAFVFELMKFLKVTLGQQVHQELVKVAIIVRMDLEFQSNSNHSLIVVNLFSDLVRIVKFELHKLPTVCLTARSTASAIVFAAVATVAATAAADYYYCSIELIVAFLSFYESFLIYSKRCKSVFLRLYNRLQTIQKLKYQVHLRKGHLLVLRLVFLGLSFPLFKYIL